MNAKRLFLVLSLVLAALVLGLFGTTYVMAGIIKTKSTQLATSKAHIEQLNQQQTSLVKSKRDIAKYSSLETITDGIVPQDKDQAATVREIINIAAANSVTLTTISFPSSTLGTTGVGAAVTGASTPAAAVSPATKPNLSQLTLVKNIPGVYNLQLTVSNNSNNTVSFAQLSAFLKGLENNRRTAAVSSINIVPQSASPNQLVFTIIMNVYIKP